MHYSLAEIRLRKHFSIKNITDRHKKILNIENIVKIIEMYALV